MTLPKVNPFSKKPTDLPDSPSPVYSAQEIKEHFQTPSDELATAHNSLVNSLEAPTGASEVGAKEGTANTNVQAFLNKLSSDKATNERVTTAENRVTGVEGRLTNAEEDISTLFNVDSSLQSQINTSKSDITSLKTNKAEKTEIQTLQNQVDRLVVDGDSSPAIAQALSGTSYTTLKQKLDATDAQLAEKAQQLTVDTLIPKKYVFGGQLTRLKEALSNPLEQYMSIIFIGDSITWGMTLPENPTITPRDGTLSDVRDLYVSPSFVNLFKKYLGEKYFFNASPVLSNWSASPSGESIVEFSKEHIMFPYSGDFINDYVNPVNNTPIVTSSASSISNMQLSLNVANTQAGSHRIAFTFTGNEFTLYYSSIVNSMKYELFVDGVSQGVFDTAIGVDGNVSGFNNQRKHTFPYVKNKIVEIKTVLGSYVGTNTLKIDGIKFNKKIRISNQGIIGTSAMFYKSRNLDGNTNGDGSAVEANDRYVFIQLGTNDRIITSGYAKGTNEFKKNLSALIDFISSGRELVLLAANPVTNESTTSYSFNMQEVRNTVYRVAKEKNVDFIDNYSVFAGRLTTEFTADGTHPNTFGHKVMANNIINSLEFN